MKTRKNFLAAGVLSLIWVAFYIFAEMMRHTNYNLLAFMVGGVITFLATYQVLRILQYVPDVLEKQESKSRTQHRMDDFIQQMDRDQLAALRERLADVEDDEYESIGLLLDDERRKRKNR